MTITGIMKISNLINQLKSIQLEHGNIECAKVLHTAVNPDEYGYSYETSLTEPDIEVIDNPCGDGKILMLSED